MKPVYKALAVLFLIAIIVGGYWIFKINQNLKNNTKLDSVFDVLSKTDLQNNDASIDLKNNKNTSWTVEPAKNTENKKEDAPAIPVVSDIKPSKMLDLSNRGLTKIPMETFDMIYLEELNLSGNRLTGAIPAEIRHLKNLRILIVSNNEMTGLPAEIGQLENLEVLDVSRNQLVGLPYELGNLKNLKTFNLSGNNYSKLDLDIISKEMPNTEFIIK